MEEEITLTEDQQLFVNLCDQDIVTEIWESFIFPEIDLTFENFYNAYQTKHFEKYGKLLTL